MKKKIIPLLVVSALSFGGLFGCSADIPTDTGPNYGDSVLGKDAEIVSITKTGSDGLVDTYTILYGDGKTTTFTVTNGKDGEQGIEGKPGSDGHTPTITIGENGNWFIDGVDSNISAKGEKGDKGDTGETGPHGPAGDKGDKGDKGDTGPQGPSGEDGKSVVSIEKTSSSGLVDTYTITYSDGTTSTFTVTNGQNGEQGVQGNPGADGHTPTITIGENGNWFIDGVDSNISAKGEKGDKGDTGETGPQGPAGDKGDKGDTGEKGDTAWSNTILPVEGGYVKVNVGSALVGEDVTFTLVAKNGYFAEAIILNDFRVDLGGETTYTTAMVEHGFVVEGVFTRGIILDGSTLSGTNPVIGVENVSSNEDNVYILDNISLGNVTDPVSISFVGNQGKTTFKGTLDEYGLATTTLYIKDSEISGKNIVFENINLVVVNSNTVDPSDISGSLSTLSSGNGLVSTSRSESITFKNVDLNINNYTKSPLILDSDNVYVNNVNVSNTGSAATYNVFTLKGNETQLTSKAIFEDVNVEQAYNNAISLASLKENAEISIKNCNFGTETTVVNTPLRVENANPNAKANNGTGVNAIISIDTVTYHSSFGGGYEGENYINGGFAVLNDSTSTSGELGDFSDLTLNVKNLKSYQNGSYVDVNESNGLYYQYDYSRIYYIESSRDASLGGDSYDGEASKLPTLNLNGVNISDDTYLTDYSYVSVNGVDHAIISVDKEKTILGGSEVTVNVTTDKYYKSTSILVNGSPIVGNTFIASGHKKYVVSALVEKDYTSIEDVVSNYASGMDVLVKATVVQKNSKSAVIYDGTDSMLIYSSNIASTLSVNDVIEVKGTVSTYKDYVQFENSATIEVLDETPISLPAIQSVDGTFIDSFTSGKQSENGMPYVEFVGTFVKSGNYNNVNVDGTSSIISLNTNLTLTSGKKYTFKGFMGYTTGNTPKYVNFFPVSAEEYYAPVETITTSESTLSLDIGASKSISVSVAPSDAKQGYTYSLAEGGDAYVNVSKDSEGNIAIEGVAAGSTSLIIKSEGLNSSGEEVTKIIPIEVNNVVATLNSITITNTETKLGVGAKLEITYVTDPVGFSGTYEFISSNTAVADFTDSSNPSILEGLSEGTTNITVKCGEIVSAAYTITVENNDVEETLYTSGFENSEGFKASTTYNNKTETTFGPAGKQWGTLYGSASTSKPVVSGSQSIQMRTYASQTINPTLYMKFDETNVTSFSIDYKCSSAIVGNKIVLLYSLDEGSTWKNGVETTISSTSQAGNIEYNIATENGVKSVSKVRFKLVITGTINQKNPKYSFDNPVIKGYK